MTDEQLYRDMKALQKYPEWTSFISRLNICIQEHKESSVKHSIKGNALDSQRQAWIAEGIRDAMEEPEGIVKTYEFSISGLFQKVTGKLKS